MSAANALLRAIHERLSGDADLLALTGGRILLDRLADGIALPLITAGEMETRDASTASEAGEEHLFSLTVWSDAQGRREAEQIAYRLKVLLHDGDLQLDRATLVSLFHRDTRTRREPGRAHFSAELRFRAVTEQ